jgi:hypothetical protein
MRRIVVLPLLALLALPGVASAAKPLAPASIVSKLNAERAELGLDPVVEQPDWSAKCALHNRWMRRNGRLQHEETPGTPGRTEAGAWAGEHAVLAGDGVGWRFRNPWINAPIHLSQTYNPALRTVGTSDASRHSCLTTWPGMDYSGRELPLGATQADHVVTFPADGGVAPFGQVAREVPFTPQQKVGLRSSKPTGPYLYVWAYTDRIVYPDDFEPVIGWDETTGEPIFNPLIAAEQAELQRIAGGSLIGPGGRRVAVKVIDNAQVDNHVGAGNGWLLPVKPLKPKATYKATVILDTGAEVTDPAYVRQVTHTWTFRTDSRPLGYSTRRCRSAGCGEWRWP